MGMCANDCSRVALSSAGPSTPNLGEGRHGHLLSSDRRSWRQHSDNVPVTTPTLLAETVCTHAHVIKCRSKLTCLPGAIICALEHPAEGCFSHCGSLRPVRGSIHALTHYSRNCAVQHGSSILAHSHSERSRGVRAAVC